MEKRVNPQLRASMSSLPQEEFTKEGLPEIRAAMSQQFLQLEALSGSVCVTNRYIPGPDGAPDVRVRIYEPAKKTQECPGLLFIHGGGYILGNPEMSDDNCQQLVLEIGCVIVSVDYRLAPEHPFPEPLEDCYAALKWFSENTKELGVDPARIATIGMSAGGGLTAALSLLARDRKGPPIVFQMPLYPMLDDRNTTYSSHEITDARVWSRDKNIFGWAMYLGTENRTEVSKYAAPARETDLSGLPPTYTCIGELDVFRDETIDYVTRLIQAGVSTEFHIYPGCFHGFDAFVPTAEISMRAVNEYIQVLKVVLQK